MAEAVKTRRRWFQFSLRTLLVIVTLVCVAIGYPLSRARNEERASQQLTEAGFFLSMDGRGPLVGEPEMHPRGPTWFCSLAGDYVLDHTRFVGLHVQRTTESDLPDYVADDELLPLRHLHHVETVWLTGFPLTDEGLRSLAHLRRLRTLDLSNTRITDDGLGYLARLQSLEYLNLSSTMITDAGLKQLRGLKNLRWLCLSNTKIDGPGLEHLAALGQLAQLDLDGTGVHSADLRSLVACTKLRVLNLGHTKIDDSASEFLRQMTSLDCLHMDWEDVGSECIDAMLELPNLKHMSVSPERLVSNDLRSRLETRFVLRVEGGMLIGDDTTP